MTPQAAINAIIDMVPNWYRAECGPESYTLAVGDARMRFFSHRRPTPQASAFLAKVRADLPDLIARVQEFPTSVGKDLIQEYFAEYWLQLFAPEISWRRLFDYARETSSRTYENESVSFNLVVTQGQGTHDVTTSDEPNQKLLDPLASSRNVYFEVDPTLRFIAYREIGWDAIRDVAEYQFYPEFLHPFVSILNEGQYSVHQLRRGDLIIMDHGGLLAAKRKGRWKIYDAATLKNSIVDIVGDYRVGCNLFDVVFDLSFRRHGALLLFDPDHVLNSQISNPGSRLLNAAERDAVRTMLLEVIHEIRMGAQARAGRKKGLFLEIASLDGAVVFNSERVVAFGAMIKPHGSAPGQAGARSTAAISAYKHGALPIKISSDGDITFYFTSQSPQGERCEARLEFL